MEQLASLRDAEKRLGLMTDRLLALQAKVEDLLLRAQKISNRLKNNQAGQDSMFGYDLQNCRHDIRSNRQEIEAFPALLSRVERAARGDPSLTVAAQSVMNNSMRLAKAVASLREQSLLAHQHIRQADHKVEAWYLAQEVQELARSVQPLPGVANKILVRVSAGVRD